VETDDVTEPTTEWWVVDRVEGGIAVVVQEDDEIVVEVGVAELGSLAVEGAVLRVPLGTVGEPVWAEAARDQEAEAARRTEADERIADLQKRDPGGDIEL
jgi:hypothetical protein